MLAIRLAWDQPSRPPDGISEHSLLIGLTPQANARRLAANICLVLDCSGSMDGEKLCEARRACQVVYEALDDDDLLSLVAFNSRATARIEPVRRGDLRPETLQNVLDNLRAEGLTRTELALDLASQLVRPYVGADRTTSLILITDGHPTDADGQNRPASQYDIFFDMTAKLAEEGIITIAVGLGSARHYNSRFLGELADRGRGTFCYAPHPQQLASLMQQQVHAAKSAVLQGVELLMTPLLPGVQMTAACLMLPRHRPAELLEDHPGQATRLVVGAIEVDEQSTETILLARVRMEAVFGIAAGQQQVLQITPRVRADGQHMMTGQPATAVLYFVLPGEQRPAPSAEAETLRLRWDMIRCQQQAETTNQPLRASRMLDQLAQSARQLGLTDVQDQVQSQIGQLKRSGRIDPDAATRTSQLLRATSRTSAASETSIPVHAGIGFGGAGIATGFEGAANTNLVGSTATHTDSTPSLPANAVYGVLEIVDAASCLQRFVLSAPRVMIGRKPAAVNIDLSSHDNPQAPTVAEHHCELQWDGHTFQVHERGGTVLLNDQAIAIPVFGGMHVAATVQNGDLLKIGSVVLRYMRP